LAERVDRHGRVMMLRAEAVALLHGRGSDVRERVARHERGARRAPAVRAGAGGCRRPLWVLSVE
jgi:hypothetical protein